MPTEFLGWAACFNTAHPVQKKGFVPRNYIQVYSKDFPKFTDTNVALPYLASRGVSSVPDADVIIGFIQNIIKGDTNV